jgi:uncharacterized membrane protein
MIAGLTMVIAGQLLRKMRALAASLTGCGLAVMMATTFAANVALDPPVLPQQAAFIGVMIIGAAGIALSLHMRIMALTILALLGMYLSPLILRSHQDHSLQLLTYLAVVTVTGLGVSSFKRTWWAVRGLAFGATWLWMFTWAIMLAQKHGDLGRAFAGLFFMLFLGEMVANLVRVTGPAKDESQPDRPASPNTLLLETGASLLSFANTALAMTVFAIIYSRAWGIADLWMIALGLAGVMGIVTFVTSSRYFTMSAGIQAIGLVVLAVPLYFEHSAITFAWAILGLGLAVYAYLTDSRAARAWMFIMLALVTLRLFTFDALDPRLHGTLFIIAGEKISQWLLMSWGAALYALGLGWLGRRRDLAQAGQVVAQRGAVWTTNLCGLVGSLLWCIPALTSLHFGHPLSLAVVAWVLILIGLGYATLKASDAIALEGVAVAVLLVVNLKWAAYDGLALSVMYLDQGEQNSSNTFIVPVLNLFVLNGVLVALAILWSRIIKRAGRTTQIWWIVALAFVALNIEVLRSADYWLSRVPEVWLMKNVIISVLWGLIGLSGILLGFSRKIASVRWVSLILLGFTVTKVLLVDMAHVETMFRVLSFLAVGIVLLLVSFVYHKVGAILLDPKPAPAASDKSST